MALLNNDLNKDNQKNSNFSMSIPQKRKRSDFNIEYEAEEERKLKEEMQELREKPLSQKDIKKATFESKKKEENKDDIELIVPKKEKTEQKSTMIKKVNLQANKENIVAKKATLPTAPKPTLSSGFSLLPIDEEEILYSKLPNALKKILYTFAFFALIALGIWYFASNILFDEIVKANSLQNDLMQIQNERLKYDSSNNEIKIKYEYYRILGSLLKNHITWLKFFAYLEKYTVPEVYYTNFTVTAGHETNIAFNVYAKDLPSALKQYKIFRDYASDFCKDVKMTNLRFVEGEDKKDKAIMYNLTFTLLDDIFYHDDNLNNKNKEK